MLKSKKILPLVMIGVAPAVTPLFALTSCSKIKLEDITTKFTSHGPSFAKYDGPELKTEEEIMDAYVDFVQNRYDDFVTDMQWGMWQNWMSFLDWSNFTWADQGLSYNAKLKTLKFGVSKPSFGEVTIAPPGTKPQFRQKFKTASFKMKTVVEATVETKVNDGKFDTKISHDIKFEATSDIKNILMFSVLGQRGDKTCGHTPEGLNDAYKPTWFITPHEDSAKQYHYSYYQDYYCIDYDAKMTDSIDEEYGQYITHRTEKYDASGAIDDAAEMSEITELKSYAASMDGTYFNPTYGWNQWFNQSPFSWLANAIVPDIATAYFDVSSASGLATQFKAVSGEDLYQYYGDISDNGDVTASGWGMQVPDGCTITSDQVKYQLGYINPKSGEFENLDESSNWTRLELGDENYDYHHYFLTDDESPYVHYNDNHLELIIPNNGNVTLRNGFGGATYFNAQGIKLQIKTSDGTTPFDPDDWEYNPSAYPKVSKNTICQSLQFALPKSVPFSDPDYSEALAAIKVYGKYTEEGSAEKKDFATIFKLPTANSVITIDTSYRKSK